MDIIEQILNIAKKQKTFTTLDVVKKLKNKASRQYVARVISILLSEGKLVKTGATKHATYALPENAASLGDSIKKRLRNEKLKEHEVLDNIEHPALVLNKLSENVKSIFTYAFSEMLNNAIEHSRSDFIDIEVNKSDKNLHFIVRDFGVGVFNSIMNKKHLRSELEAIQDLLKGKTTTSPQSHSGEGIFFTSKSGDEFVLESYGYKLRIDNKIKDIFIEKLEHILKGTRVSFIISLDLKKHLNDIFAKYQTNPKSYAFDKTEVQVKLYIMGTVYVSRSQARRVLVGLDKFKTIIMDFNKVPTIGQAFADEIFRVFKIDHPGINIIPINMNEAVKFMVGRVEKPL